ncbi:MAG TPA: glycosyltransferase [Candidatus Woesebacteria bacterium]|nr:glycosyltransferase [Candidatus Woesebacteria bacterium]
MNKVPFFSIIIPCLNEEKDLPVLLKDLSQQTLQDFEVIVVDGESKDKTVTKAKGFDKKLPSLTILTSKIRNVSVQRNMGGEAGRGKYLVFNDADNRLPKHFLEGVKYHLDVKPADMFTTWCLPDSKRQADKTIATYLNLLIETGQLVGLPGALGAMIGCLKTKFGKYTRFDPNIGFAEDAEFVREGHRNGCSFSVFREPRYVYSLRRFRKMGTLRFIQKHAVLYTKLLTNQKIDQKKEYPMGGAFHNQKEGSAPEFFRNLQAIFVKKELKKKIVDQLRALLSLEEAEGI